MVTGEYRGRPFTAFEFSYRTKDRQSDGPQPDIRKPFQVVAVTLTSPIPAMAIDRCDILERAVRWLGISQTDLGDSVFDKAFSVSFDDRAQATSVLTEPVRGWLLRDPRAAENPVRIHGAEMLTWEQRDLNVDDVPRRLDYLIDLLEQLEAAR